ncbi:hypothetical protein F5Y11DRAFT_345493 [Daldinia sp. FL1419]|nr:hypothetical protein F5Y11DRAFT_345493 [Daldinia sp. FL1419]
MITTLEKLRKPIPKELHRVPLITQRDSWTCGFWCAYTLYMIKRRPRELLSTVKNDDHYEKLDNYMKSLAGLAAIRVISSPVLVPVAIMTSETTKSEPSPKQVPREMTSEAIHLPKSKPIRMYSMKQGHKRRVTYFERKGPNLYTWPGKTPAESAVRPQPSIPLEWPGWEAFEQAFERIELNDDNRSARQAHDRDQRALNRDKKRSKVEEQHDD